MTYTVVNNPPPPHRCVLPHTAPMNFYTGAIIQCDDCGQQWKLDEYDRWYKMAPPKPPPVAHPKYTTQRGWWKR